MNKNKKKTVLCLGGGSSRGYAHIGVLRCLEEEKIHFDMLIGVSMGAVVGSVYAVTPDSHFLEERMMSMLSTKEFNSSLLGMYNRIIRGSQKNVIIKLNKIVKQTGLIGKMLTHPGIASQKEIDETLFPLIANIQIQNTKLPFATVAVNLEKGSSKVFTQGSLRATVIASAAIPMISPIQYIDNEPYVDGGVLDKIGIDAALSLGFKKILAVDVSNKSLVQENIKNGLDVLMQTEEISAIYRRNKQMQNASLVLHPIQENIHWADFDSAKNLIQMGYDTTKQNIEEIRYRLKIMNPFKRIFYFSKK